MSLIKHWQIINATDKTWSDMQHYLTNDLKLRKFVPIIQQSVVYPVILDANRTVLSLPPIINGAHSAVRPSDSFVFVVVKVVIGAR